VVGGWLFDNWKPVGPFLYMAASNATLFVITLLTIFFTRRAARLKNTAGGSR
jgi:hypothetical protein